MSGLSKEQEERRTLNGLWHKSKAKLIILRLACGLDSHGRGEVSRQHLYVPDTPGNAMLDCARALVEDGLGEWNKHGLDKDHRLKVTEEGVKRARTGLAPAKAGAEAFDAEAAKANAALAQDLLLSVREALHGEIYRSKDGRKLAPIDACVASALSAIGEVCYRLKGEGK